MVCKPVMFMAHTDGVVFCVTPSVMIITCACTSQDSTCLPNLVWFLASAPGTWSAYTATIPDDCSVGVFPAECSAPAAVAPALAILLPGTTILGEGPRQPRRSS